jgi:hypothetical protein
MLPPSVARAGRNLAGVLAEAEEGFPVDSEHVKKPSAYCGRLWTPAAAARSADSEIIWLAKLP